MGGERAIQHGVGQPGHPPHGGVHVIGQRGQQIDAFADVPPGRGGAYRETGGQSCVGVAVTQVGQHQ